MESDKENHKEKKIVEVRRLDVLVTQAAQLGAAKRTFVCGGYSSQLLAATKCSRNQLMVAVRTDMWVVRFELVANARKVGINGFWTDMVAHENGIETQSVRGGLDGEVVRPAEGYIGLEGRGIRSRG